MTFEEWLIANPVAPRTEELHRCWTAAQAAMQPVGWGWFEDGILAGATAEKSSFFNVPLYTPAIESPEERRKFGGRQDD